MRPENGGRLEFKLTESGATTARYQLTIFTAAGDAKSVATLDSLKPGVELQPWQGATLPAWLEAFAMALLRVLARNKGAATEWPRRVTRWRPEPER